MTAGMPAPITLPEGLRQRVLVASARARVAGQAVPEVSAASPAEAFSRAADALGDLLDSLREDDWRQPVIRSLDARGLVGHLIGVEEDVHRALAGDPAVANADHVASTSHTAARQAGRDTALITSDWRRAVGRTLALVSAEASADRPVAVHGIMLPISDLLVARTFEIWTHENDIRTATGQPHTVPGPTSLQPMTSLAVRLLPFGAIRIGLADPVGVHLVLTGPGGGTWDLVVGQGKPDPAQVTVVADVVGFCRLVANRIAPADLDAHVTGDLALAASVLASAAALALD
jgi:uncharacterized protein (TIGR03083 family)